MSNKPSTPAPSPTVAPADKGRGTGGETLLGDILLEEVVEALDAARNTQPIVTPPLPHEAGPRDAAPAPRKSGPAQGAAHGEVSSSRPDRPGHHNRGD